MWDSVPLPRPRRGRLEIRCVTLTLPVGDAGPGRGSLDVAMIRVRPADRHDRISSLVLNPAGAGLSGLGYMPVWASWLPDALPADQATAATPSLLTDSGFAAAMARRQAQAQFCVDALGDRTAAFSTDATARDLDLLRGALGEDVVTFVGWLYGCAARRPLRVSVSRLGARVDPRRAAGSAGGARQRRRVADRRLRGRVRGVRRPLLQRESCVRFGDPRALFDRVERTARSTPIPSDRPVGHPPANAEAVLRAVLGLLASPRSLALPRHRRREADGNSGSLYVLDSLEGTTLAAQLRAEATRPARTYLRFGGYGSRWLFRCTFWTAPHPVLPILETITASPVLVIATEADPATPYYGGDALARALGPSADLFTVSGGGHTALERWPCVAQLVTRYLVEVRLPGGHAC